MAIYSRSDIEVKIDKQTYNVLQLSNLKYTLY